MPSLTNSSLSPSTFSSTRRQRSLWWGAIFVAILIIFLGGWIWWLPQWRLIKSLQTGAEVKVDRVQQQQAVEKELRELNNLVAEYNRLAADDKIRLDLSLPRGQDIPNLLAQIEGIATRTNFIIKDISFSAVNPNERTERAAVVDSKGTSFTPSAEELKINLVVEGGDYADLKKFVKLTAQSQILLKLTAITFTTKSAGSGGISYTLNFQTTYLP